MKAALPFLAYFVGDGSTVAFTLDTIEDPFYLSNHISLNANDAVPTPAIENLSTAFDVKSYPSDTNQVAMKNAANNSDLGTPTVAIDGHKITFTLSSAPGNAVLCATYGFIVF